MPSQAGAAGAFYGLQTIGPRHHRASSMPEWVPSVKTVIAWGTRTVTVLKWVALAFFLTGVVIHVWEPVSGEGAVPLSRRELECCSDSMRQHLSDPRTQWDGGAGTCGAWVTLAGWM